MAKYKALSLTQGWGILIGWGTQGHEITIKSHSSIILLRNLGRIMEELKHKK